MSSPPLPSTSSSTSPESTPKTSKPINSNSPSSGGTGTGTSHWSTPIPSTFVNGRGNVQLASTPRNFIPSSSIASSTSGSNGKEKEKERSYLKGGGSSNSNASNFGVRQRMIVVGSPSTSSSSSSTSSNNGPRRTSIAITSNSGSSISSGSGSSIGGINSRKLPSVSASSASHSNSSSFSSSSTPPTPITSTSAITTLNTVLQPSPIIKESEEESSLNQAVESENSDLTFIADTTSNADENIRRSGNSTPVSSNTYHPSPVTESSEQSEQSISEDESKVIETEAETTRIPTNIPITPNFTPSTQALNVEYSKRSQSPSSISTSTSTSTLTPTSTPTTFPFTSSALSQSQPQSQSPSPSSPEEPPLPFILYRPRPARPDSFTTSTVQNNSNLNRQSSVLERSTSLLKRDFGLIPKRVIGSGSSIGSEGGGVMNRARPRTPDPFSSGSGGDGSISTISSPILRSSSNSSNLLSPNLATSSLFSSSQSNSTSSTFSNSVLNRPRPKTPDPNLNSLLDSPEKSSSSFTYLHTRGRPSYSLPSTSHSPVLFSNSTSSEVGEINPGIGSWSSRFDGVESNNSNITSSATNSNTSLSGSNTRRRVEEDETGFKGFSGFQPNFNFGSPSSTSTSSTSSSSGGFNNNLGLNLHFESPPKLNLNLDLDNSFGSSTSNSSSYNNTSGGSENIRTGRSGGGMFDLDSLLKIGEEVGLLAQSESQSTQSTPRRILGQRGIGVGSDLSVSSPAHSSTSTSTSTSGSTSNSNLNRQNSRNFTPKLLPRKEAPKVDLKLELELEIDAVMSPSTLSHLAKSNAVEEEDQSLTPTANKFIAKHQLLGFPPTTNFSSEPSSSTMFKRPSTPNSLTSNPTSIGSGSDSRNGSISSIPGGEKSQTQVPTRRKQRSSISSMLSFKSTTSPPSISTPTLSSSDNHSQSSPSFIPLSLTTSRNSTTSSITNYLTRPQSSLDKSLPSTPQTLSPIQHQKQLINKSSGNNLLTRQFSKLRGSGNHKSESSTSSLTSSSVFNLRNTSTNSSSGGFHKSSTPSISSINSVNTGSLSTGTTRRFAEKFGMSRNSSTSTTSTSTNAHTNISTPREESRITYYDDEFNFDELPPPRPSSRVGKFLKNPLGTKLPQARKSEDFLTKFNDTDVVDRAVDGEDKKGDGKSLTSRRSFDLLTQRKTMPRRPSIDNLLNLAAAQLSKLKPSSSQNKSTTIISLDQPQEQSSTISIPSTNSHYSRSSSRTPSISDSNSIQSNSSAQHENEDASVTVATRMIRTNSNTIPSPSILPTTVPNNIASSERSISPITSRDVTNSADAHIVIPITSDGKDKVVVEEELPKTWRKRRAKIPDSGMGSDASMTNDWLNLEDALIGYSKAVEEDLPERGNTVANILIPFLKKEGETPAPQPHDMLAKRQREVLFGWLSTLTTELRELQPSHRGACLEALASIAESKFMSAQILEEDSVGQIRFRTGVIEILAFAIDKLNEKAVYANTLVFAGRIFALAFFRVEGVAIKILRALPPIKKQTLKRILSEAGIDENNLPFNTQLFPSHLSNLCLKDLRSYSDILLPSNLRPQTEDDKFLVCDENNVVEMSGNWLIRFTASDSDLPFAFYRAYHRQAATYLCPADLNDYSDMASPFTVPGFLFLAASLLEKLDALIHRTLRSVTSIGPGNANLNINDSANIGQSQKPKVLELANRRIVSTLLDIVGGPPTTLLDGEEISLDVECRKEAFSSILQIWLRACIKRTSLYDTRSVFLLLDLLEGVIYTLSYPAPSSNRNSTEESIISHPSKSSLELFDIPFIFSFIKIILLNADNTIALMRTIAFLYAHFEIFTLRNADRVELCEKILLDPKIFSRLYLHWNFGVRTYFVRILVWRIARLGIVDSENHPNNSPDPRIISIFNLLNMRLEAIRQRHDELEPENTSTDEDDLFRPKRSTICSTRGVKEAPYTVGEIVNNKFYDESEVEEDSEGEETKEVMQSTTASTDVIIKKSAPVSRFLSLLKGGLGKSKTAKTKIISIPQEVGIVNPFILESIPSSEAVEAGRFDSNTSQYDDNSSISSSSPQRSPIKIRSTRPLSSSFFSFEFEGTSLDSDSNNFPIQSSSSSISINSTQSLDTVFPSSPIRRRLSSNSSGDSPFNAISPRVSLRFSKRISILPPAALEVLKENGEIIPPLPTNRFGALAGVVGYDKLLHPYAIKGLCDYEDAIDEWTDWTRLQESEGEKNKSFVDVVPRLSVGWSWTEDGP